MSLLRAVRRDWNEFFFAPLSAAPLGLLRIFYGLIVLGFAALLYPDRFLWYGSDGVLSVAQAPEAKRRRTAWLSGTVNPARSRNRRPKE